MSWFWLNIPLGAVFFLATAGIPLFMVLKYPDERPAESARRKAAAAATPRDARVRDATVTDATPQSRPAFARQLSTAG